jgi:hypothetical protein
MNTSAALMRVFRALSICVALSFTGTGQAQTTWFVDAQAPWPGAGSRAQPYTTVDDALFEAASGDTILVGPGVYQADHDGLRIENMDVVIRSDVDGSAATHDPDPSQTTLQSDGSWQLLSLTGNTENTVIEGFTLSAGAYGAAVEMHSSAAVLRGCVITGNENFFGGIVNSSFGSPTLDHCDLVDNLSVIGAINLFQGDPFNPTRIRDCRISGTRLGCGIYIDPRGVASVRIERCQITDNEACGLLMRASYVEVVDTLIARNRSSGIICSADGLVLRNVTIIENETTNSLLPGGIYVSHSVPEPRAAVEMVNSIVFANQSPLNQQIAVNSTTGSASFAASYSLIQGGFAGIGLSGNAITLSEGPAILNTMPGVDSVGRILAGSACIDAGDPDANLVCERDIDGNPRSLDGDLDGNNTVDLGCSEFSHVQLAMVGTPQPGATITFVVSGTNGLKATLGFGDPALALPLDPFGCTWMSLIGTMSVGTLPTSIDITIPSDIPTPRELTVQVLAGSAAAANLSNPVTVRVE